MATEETKPCGSCRDCVDFVYGRSMDLREVEATSKKGMERKYIFNKIKETDIVTRLKKLCANENLDVESHALDLIALNADGSLRDAETMLDQLSLLGNFSVPAIQAAVFSIKIGSAPFGIEAYPFNQVANFFNKSWKDLYSRGPSALQSKQLMQEKILYQPPIFHLCDLFEANRRLRRVEKLQRGEQHSRGATRE
ncbi:hypothetical protein Syun_014076 [Stephania yunnanensis]|uniref:DNA polymerase III subunit gamma/tau helical lid domain-containing protein n=1 Tax=Stephania yunnanensis TaxID=152371 RepID=A0AAP0JJQ4_9MAGN